VCSSLTCPSKSCTVAGPRFHQVRRVRVPQQMRRDAFLQVGAHRGFATRIPHDLRGDRLVSPSSESCRETIRSSAASSGSTREGLQQSCAERHVAIATTLAVLNVNQRAPAVDVADLQVAELGVPHVRRAQDHEHHAMGEILRPIDQAGDSVVRITGAAADFRKRDVLQQVGGFSVLTKKNRSAGTWSLTVRGPSFRARNRYA
jgi:hypothetical protein